MNLTYHDSSTAIAANALRSVREKGVHLWSENGQLHYRAPKGALSREEIQKLQVWREQIIALLERAGDSQAFEPRVERGRLDRSPLSFSQLARWHLHQLSGRFGVRQVASATRLRGPLNVRALKESISEVVRRHGSLRTRIVVRDAVPIQEISESSSCELEVIDLTQLSEDSREAEVQRLIEQFILEPIDFAVGPLFGVRLLNISDDEHVLILAMEHMISDMFSLNILTRELFAAYVDALRGRAFSLPAIPMQFAEYAVWQRNAQKSSIERHGWYWNQRLAGCPRLRFPSDQSETNLGWGIVEFQISRTLKEELRAWCRVRRTTLVMGAFAAYIALVLRWCDASETVIQYQADCRTSSKIENTIGLFASVLYVRIALSEDDSFVALLNRVTEEYCNAYEHVDFSYLASNLPRPVFTRNTLFNWIPQGPNIDLSELHGSEGVITYSRVDFANPILSTLELDHEPVIVLNEKDDEVVGGVYFPLNQHSHASMQRFASNFLVFIRALLTQPEARVKDILLI